MNYSKNKRVKIFGVPIDLGSSPLGVKMGPAAIRSAGLFEALRYNNIEYFDFGDLTVNENHNDNDGAITEIARISNQLCSFVSESLQDDYLPITLGGDHSASIGSIAGVSKQESNIGLLWLDCHPDANTPRSSLTGNIHGMTVAISLGHGHSSLINCGGHAPKIKPENICIIGAKDIDQAEYEFISNNNITMFTIFDIIKHGIVNILDQAFGKVFKSCDGIHLSFDIDALDPIIAPGTGITSKGGLNYREIAYIMQFVGQTDLLRSIDIIEINPLLDIRNQTAELSIELLLSALGGSYGDYEKHYMNQSIS